MQLDAVIAQVAARSAEVAAVVARDLAAAHPTASADPGAAATAAVDWLLAELRAGERVRPASLEPLRAAARAAALEGRPVATVLDPILTAGWAVWEEAASVAAFGPVLPALGGVLLRAGDAAAAAIATAHADAEALLAAGTASARREYLDELLAARPGDPGMAALVRRGPAFGLEAGMAVDLVLAALVGRELTDDDRAIDLLATALGPRAPVVAAERGRALVVLRAGAVPEAGLRAALDGALGRGRWTAIRAHVPNGPAGLGAAAADANAALSASLRLGHRARVDPTEASRLEQAMLADPSGLAAGAEAVLAPLLTASRAGDRLVETLRVFLESAGNRRETARRLGLAPRTVAYRLGRVEARIGERLSGPALIRLAAALHARSILEPPPEAVPADAEPPARRRPIRRRPSRPSGSGPGPVRTPRGRPRA